MERLIYVASSWRNPYQPAVVSWLVQAGYRVFDFRVGPDAFQWADIDPAWEQWTVERFVAALTSPLAIGGYASDMRALEQAGLVVLVLPCGSSAHLEAGWIVGRGFPLIIFAPERVEPELMYGMAYAVTEYRWELLGAVSDVAGAVGLAQVGGAEVAGETEHKGDPRG